MGQTDRPAMARDQLVGQIGGAATGLDRRPSQGALPGDRLVNRPRVVGEAAIELHLSVLIQNAHLHLPVVIVEACENG